MCSPLLKNGDRGVMVGYAPGHVPADFTDYQPEIPLTVCARIVLGHKGHGNVLFRRNLIAVAGQQTGVDGVGSINKDMTMGAIEACKAVGRDKEMVQVTFDVDNDCLDAIDAGDILITGAQEEKSQIANAIYACLLACNGYKVAPEQYIPMTLTSRLPGALLPAAWPRHPGGTSARAFPEAAIC